MVMTSATLRACLTARRALAGTKPIMHIVTDDFLRVMSVMDEVFFTGSATGRTDDPVKYTRLQEFLLEARADKTSAKENWDALIHRHQILFLTPDGDGELDRTSLDYLMDFQEQHRRSRYLSGKSLPSRAVIYGRKLKLPAVLEPHVARVEFPELRQEDFLRILEHLCRPTPAERQSKSFTQGLNRMAQWYANQLAGFPENEVLDILQEILYAQTREEQLELLLSTTAAEKIIRREKNNRLKVHDKLECIDVKSQISGLEPVRNWVLDHKANITRTSFPSEEDITKGILLLGLPGTGKSLLAKCCATLLDLPLLRLDISSLLGKYVGESEANMDQMLEDLTLAGAPCVFWIDEIDKALSGVGKDTGGGAVMDRLFGKILTFMQEMRRPVFLVTTANDISKLPPELFRSGRFSRIFSLMLPSYTECVQIMGAKLEHHLGEDPVSAGLPANMMDICCGLKKWNGYALVSQSGEDSVRFLTGADISEMAKEMCTYLGILPGSGEGGKFTKAQLYAAMQKAADGQRASVDPRIPLTLTRAAESYHKALEQGAVSANHPGTPNSLENYQPGNVRQEPSEDGLPQCLKPLPASASDYDRQLYRQIGLAMDSYIRKQT